MQHDASSQIFEYTVVNDNKLLRNGRLVFQIGVPVFLLIMLLFFNPEEDNIEFLRGILIVWLPISTFVVLVTPIIFYFVPKIIGEIKINLSDVAIERKHNNTLDRVNYHEIERVKIHNKHRSDEILAIEIISSQKSISIYGYKDMTFLREMVLDRIPAHAIVQTKQPRIDWLNPFALASPLFLMSVVVLGVQLYGKIDIEILFSALILIIGLVHLTFRPMVKNAGGGFRVYEIFYGLILVIGGGFFLYVRVIS